MQIKNELKKLQKFDAAYFRGKNYFDRHDGAQNSLVCQVGEKCFKNNLVVIALKLKYGNQKVYPANR